MGKTTIKAHSSSSHALPFSIHSDSVAQRSPSTWTSFPRTPYPNVLIDPKRQIRLVTIHPGKDQDAVHCTLSLQTLDLDTSGNVTSVDFKKNSHISYDRYVSPPWRPEPAQEYSALSYCWGGFKNHRYVRLNEFEDFPVSQNPWAALRRLRDRPKKGDAPRRYWIDQLCIDQHDIVERHHQVAIIAQIFHQAFQVIIWLFDTPQNHASLFVFRQSRLTKLLLRSIRHARAGELWWERAWVTQEFLAARYPPIAMYGPWEEPWSELAPGWGRLQERFGETSLNRATKRLRETGNSLRARGKIDTDSSAPETIELAVSNVFREKFTPTDPTTPWRPKRPSSAAQVRWHSRNGRPAMTLKGLEFDHVYVTFPLRKMWHFNHKSSWRIPGSLCRGQKLTEEQFDFELGSRYNSSYWSFLSPLFEQGNPYERLARRDFLNAPGGEAALDEAYNQIRSKAEACDLDLVLYETALIIRLWREKFSWEKTDQETTYRMLKTIYDSKRRLHLTSGGHSFFATRYGFIGVGPKDMQEGNEIALPYGSTHPILLEARDGAYVFKGTVFVEGITDGKLIRRSPSVKLSEKLFTFL